MVGLRSLLVRYVKWRMSSYSDMADPHGLYSDIRMSSKHIVSVAISVI